MNTPSIQKRLPFLRKMCMVITGLAFLDACSMCNKPVVLINCVEFVRWELVQIQETFMGCGLYNVECPLIMRPAYHYTDGTVQWGDLFCNTCPDNYYNPSRFGLYILEFNECAIPLTRRIRIPPHRPSPGLVVYIRSSGIQPTERDLCETRYSSDELSGDKLKQLEDFLQGLVAFYGPPAGLDPTSNNPRDVCIFVSHADPPLRSDANGNVGQVAGEIACAEGVAARARNCRYQITIYERAINTLSPCVEFLYNLMAHEFKHILQSIELGLPTGQCDQPPAERRAELEQAAQDFANLIAPMCNTCVGSSATE
jgi:hypothetical protein